MMGIGIDYALSNRIIVGVEYDWSFSTLTHAQLLEIKQTQAPTSR
jgi:hypothetical protein